jgi:hypothetical protein
VGQPVYCGLHGYMGFEPCPNCLNKPRDASERAPVVLNGERVRFEIRTKSKPWWIPWFVWNSLCRLVIRNTQITAAPESRKP